MRAIRVWFRDPVGPVWDEIMRLPTVSRALAATPVHELVHALAGAEGIVIATEIDDAEARLGAAAMRVEPVTLADYGAPWIEAWVGMSALAEDELRWTFMPSFDREVVLSARPVGARWALELRQPRVHLASAAMSEWRPGRPAMSSGHRSWVAEVEQSEEEMSLLASWRATPPTTPAAAYLDGMPIALRWRDGDEVRSERVHHPSEDQPRERAIERLGIVLAQRFVDPDAARVVSVLARYARLEPLTGR